MIARIEALNYRCLRFVAQDLNAFHVLVGPNASGKSTFLDVFALMSDLITLGPDGAVAERVPDFRDLVWMRQLGHFEVAVEVSIPDDRREPFRNGGYSRARYEVSLGTRADDEPPTILGETFWLIPSEAEAGREPRERTLFPEFTNPPSTIMKGGRRAPDGWRKIVNRVAESGNDYFSSETSNWNNLFRLGPHKSALANLPEDETKFPVATWFKELLMVGIDRLALNSERMRQPSPPRAPRIFVPDGSTLPWVVDRLASREPARFKDWINHVRTALPELKTVESIERPEDRHRYLVLELQNGLRIPSWAASDGTLRLLGLTLLAYLTSPAATIFLVEEPENGIHPRAVETVMQSLSSVYDAQVLLATHSPVILSIAKIDQVLCFAKTVEGATDIVRGSDHPGLKHWKGEVDLGTLFAGGVLGETPVHAG
jgi:ABC-type transport system involved in cytochrome c biogenesis ATPase subunit